MITGRADVYFTVAEFAAMIGREEKTVRNWAAEGRLQFVQLCGVPLVSLHAVENLITGVATPTATDGMAAMRMMNRADRGGRRATTEKHQSSGLPSSRRAGRSDAKEETNDGSRLT
jgi:hypothetical protein